MNAPSPATRTALVILLAATAALGFRTLGINLRPMHGDEANQAVKTAILLETGEYIYDPHDHHGPTLYYLALIPAFLKGQHNLHDLTESTLRAVPLAFSILLILLMWPLRQALGNLEAACAAVLLALALPLTFYSTYYIQEVLLVFFTATFLLSGWRYLRNPNLPWAIATGAAAALMHATKETAVLAFAATAIALTPIYAKRRHAYTLPNNFWKHLAAALIAAIAIWLSLYSAFFTHPRGPIDSILTYANYLQRADGAGLHDKPWYYYLSLLAYTHRAPGPTWTEAPVLIFALIGIAIILRAKFRASQSAPFLKFLAAYTLTLTAIYAVIPYKTPWSMLSFYFGFVLLACIGLGWTLYAGGNAFRRYCVAGPLVLIAFGISIAQLAITMPRLADPRNPYVYAHTSTAHLQMIETIHNIKAIHPNPEQMTVYVIQPDRDYWPIPWYLRDIENVGYFDAIPNPPDADILIIAPNLYPQLETRLQDEYMGITGGLRPNILRTVLIRQSLWKPYIATRT